MTDTRQSSGISVIICCYNSVRRLAATLFYLAQQKSIEANNWEIIVVDNASTDGTAEAALEYWEKLRCHVPFRVVSDPRPGLANARMTGVQEAKFPFVLFCDDDNWLASNYLAVGGKLISQYEKIGIIGGKSAAVFEGSVPDWFGLFERAFAVGEQYKMSGEVTFRYEKLWGAGAFYSKEALSYLFNNGFKPLLSDRKGKAIVSGGDHELFYALQLAGYKHYYNSDLCFEHFMPKGRVVWTWYTNFLRNCAVNSVYFDPYDAALSIQRGERHRWYQFSSFYGIYLILLRFAKERGLFYSCFKSISPASGEAHLDAFFLKYRLLSLVKNVFRYRKDRMQVIESSWFRNSKKLQK